MQFLEHILLNLAVLMQSFLDRATEPIEEFAMIIEDHRHQEMQQTPYFAEIVLQRRTSQKQSMARVEVKEDLPSL